MLHFGILLSRKISKLSYMELGHFPQCSPPSLQVSSYISACHTLALTTTHFKAVKPLYFSNHVDTSVRFIRK